MTALSSKDDSEDVFAPPSSWRRAVLPRRDGHFGAPEVKLDAAAAATAVAGILGQHRERLDVLLHESGNDRSLVTAVRATVDGTHPSPAGAGALAACHDRLDNWGDWGFEAFVDHWAARHGLAFAVEAVVELFGIGTGPLARRPVPSGWSWHTRPRSMAERARTLLAGADETAVAEARQRLGSHRGGLLRRGPLPARVLTSFLLPSERAWVEADVRDVVAADGTDEVHALIESVADARLLGRLLAVLVQAAAPWQFYVFRSVATAITIADGVGPSAAPVLAATCLDERSVAERTAKDPLADVLAHFPTDEAFALLLDRAELRAVRPALLDAARRFPRRALRLLGAAAVAGRHRELLRAHVLSHPDTADAALPALPGAVAALVQGELVSRAAVKLAPDGLVPEILRTPPWDRGRKRAKPTVVPGLQPPTDVRCAWAPGERERWAAEADSMSPDEVASALARVNEPGSSYLILRALAFAESRAAGPIMRSWRPDWLWGAQSLQPIVAAHEADAHGFILDSVRAKPRELAGAIAPYESVEVLILVAGWLDRRTLRATAVGWLRRHAQFAAFALVPNAVGKPGKDRKTAGKVLRLLADNGHRDEVLAAGQGYGDAAAAAVVEVLATDPVDVLPARIPTVPGWVSVPLLPALLFADGKQALPPTAVDHLLTMLVMSTPGEPYAGVERVKAACQPASLASFGWALYEQWQTSGAPTKEGWVVEALGALGDDGTVERLLRVSRADTADPRVVSALEVFVAIGSDAALLALKELSEKVKTKRVREGARAKVAEVADGLGLTADQLADRLLPDLGLGADGTTVLDYGPRRFVVGFDEQLRPTVSDEGGARRKDLPKPGARDDLELAMAAEARFRKLKKDARAVAADQIRRLERAMVEGRRFSCAELRKLFVAHPLRWHVTRRLVWATFTDDAVTADCTASFRIAEDRTFADVTDTELPITDDAVIGVAHPVHLGSDLGRWSDLFSDYEVLQPFPQLGREVCQPSSDQLRESCITDLAGARLESLRFLGLERRGWLRPEVGDGGMTYMFTKPLGASRALVVEVEPGLYAGDPTLHPEQLVRSACLTDGIRRTGSGPTLEDIGPVSASEVLRDLGWLRS